MNNPTEIPGPSALDDMPPEFRQNTERTSIPPEGVRHLRDDALIKETTGAPRPGDAPIIETFGG